MKYDIALTILEDPNVYPPSEDSELLIKSFDVKNGEKILEIGCGSGIVSIHCAKNGAVVTCGDVNENAVALTKKNASINNIKLDVHITDLYSNIDGKFDTILFNLPYLPVDEEGDLAKSWSGGKDGMGPLLKLLEKSPDHLKKNGRVIIVVSSLMNNDVLDKLISKYSVKELAELPLFFERLKVLEIRLQDVRSKCPGA